jgi:transcriptional regulator with XRE-family HTH domain
VRKPIYSPEYSYRYVADCARERGITANELCRLVGISSQSLHQWRSGKSGMTIDTKDKIEAYMKPQVRVSMLVLMQPWAKGFRLGEGSVCG